MKNLKKDKKSVKIIKAILFLSISIVCFLALYSYQYTDPSINVAKDSNYHNILGVVGAYIADILYQVIGPASYILAICFMSWGCIMMRNIDQPKYFYLRVTGMIFSIIMTSTIIAEKNIMPEFYSAGLIGILLNSYIDNYIIYQIKLNNSIFNIKIIHIFYFLTPIFFIWSTALPKVIYLKPIYLLLKFISNILIRIKNIGHFLCNKIGQLNFGTAYTEYNNELGIRSNEIEDISQQDYNNNILNNNLTEKKKTRTIFKKSPKVKENNTKPKNKILPPINLLEDTPKSNYKQATPKELEAETNALIKVLLDFGIQGKIINVKQGPVVTMYEFEPVAGTKSSRIIGLADDIARSLSALSARIALIAGHKALGIELPNKNREFFRLKELIKSETFTDPSINIPLVLGKDLTGKTMIIDLAKMPHMLVAGTTGSGKSVAINAMIMSILYRYTPSECRLIMIDPKMLELSVYDHIPHLITPVVTNPSKAITALKWAVREMEERYNRMSRLGVRNITNYNNKIMEAIANNQTIERKIQTGFDSETGEPIYSNIEIKNEKMPFIVIIVDEMADLMLVAGKEIEASIQRLAQMARAAGIHIIMATQRPSVDVITGVIKANFPSRISFKVISKIDSRTIIGEAGAEQLLGRGDMLFTGDSSKITRVHGPFVDDKEVEKVAKFLRSMAKPEYISAVTENNDIDSNIEKNNDNPQDDIYKQAVEIVLSKKKTSISYVQRSLRIGYNRAANIIERMEKEGILSEPNNSGKREILIDE